MSRRKTFDTSLSGDPSGSSSKPAASVSNSSAATKRNPSPKKQAKAALPALEDTQRSKSPDKTITAPAVSTEPDEADDNNVCFICAEPIEFWSQGICGHKTCHVCPIRLRTFYKKKDCTFCKTPLPSLSFSRNPSTPFPADHQIPSSPPERIAAAHAKIDNLKKGEIWYEGLTMPGTLDMTAFSYHDDRLQVVFEDEDMMEQTMLLMRFNCPYENCPHQASNWDTLERHTLSAHGMVICYLCRKQLNRFAHEQVLYPPHLLPLHDPSRLPRGTRPPRPRGPKEEAMVKSWETPHPMCEFCHEAFFGPDELWDHMRTKHEECFLCKQHGERMYLRNYPQLEEHFNHEHFPCTNPACLEKKFVVFASEMDLRAHNLTEHGQQLSSREAHQMRQINVDFDEAKGARRNRGHHGRGFTLQEAAASSQHATTSRREAPQHQNLNQAQTMSAEQAAQLRRQMQTDKQEEGRRRKAFVTGLTDGDPDHGRRIQAFDQDQAPGSGYATPRDDVDEATQARHAALLSRISMLTHESHNKLTVFTSAIRQYRNNESSARDMVDTVYNVLDRDVDATAGVLREVASIFALSDDTDKERSVLEAVNAFRLEQREQFPSLGNTPSGLGTGWSGIASGKILNAKRTTHTSGRVPGSRSVWDRVEAAAGSQPSSRPATAGPNGRHVPGTGPVVAAAAFPTLGAAGSSRTTGAHSTPWSSGGAGSRSQTPSALVGIVRPAVPALNADPTPKQAAAKVKPPSSASFPGLPAPSKQRTTAAERAALFAKPAGREVAASQPGGATGLEDGVDGLGMGDGVNGAPGGKKKGKQKQLLFTVSTRPTGA